MATKLAVQSTPAQQRWVDEEPQRRGIPKSAIVRDVAAEIGNPPVDARVVAYAKASNPAAALRARGGAFRAVAEQFRGDDHTAAKAVRWFRDRGGRPVVEWPGGSSATAAFPAPTVAGAFRRRAVLEP